ncbi:MAG: amino acid ABC transporter permease [Janthinobacterium lividum]
MHLSDVAAFTPILLTGAYETVLIALCSLLISVPLGMVWAFGRLSSIRMLSTAVEWLVNVVRAVPIIVWLFYIYFVMPELGITMSSFQAAIIGLGFAHSAYMSEIFRGGIQAVDVGQMEAARSIGMGKVKAMWRVVLPQAFRVALPPFSSGVVTLVKDSALSSTIAVTEMTRQGQLLASSTFQNTTVYTMVAIGYLIINLPLIRVTKFFERRIGKSF